MEYRKALSILIVKINVQKMIWLSYEKIVLEWPETPELDGYLIHFETELNAIQKDT